MGFITNNHMDMSEKLSMGPSCDKFYMLSMFTNENVDSPVFAGCKSTVLLWKISIAIGKSSK